MLLPSLQPARAFVRTVLAVSLWWIASLALFAATPASDPNRWVLMADLHIRADAQAKARGFVMADNLRLAVQAIGAMQPRPSGLLVAGDCAYGKGEPGDYQTLAGLLEPLRAAGVPYYLTVGNHDRREVLAPALGLPAEASPVPGRLIRLVRSPEANWFLLDSLEQTPATPGSLGDAQCAWLERTLDANRDRPALLIMHHHPGDPARPGCLRDTERLFAIIRPRRQVKAWIFGHTHTWRTTVDEASGLHLINLPGSGYVFVPEFPAGWIDAQLTRQGIRLEMRSVSPTHPKHGQVVNLTWRPD